MGLAWMFSKNLRKCIILAYEISRKFSKNFLRKCIILAYFSKILTNHALIFWAFGRTTQFVGNFEKIFKNFPKKIAKMHYFSIFFNEFNKPCVNLLQIWSKNANCVEILRKLNIFDENSIEKLNFFIIFGKFVNKNRSLGNNTIFLQLFFFCFGGGVSHLSPWLHP